MNRPRLALVVLVLAVAGVVALWPRDTAVRQAGPAVPSRPVADLVSARARADLLPCPRPEPVARGSGPLAGVMAICLADGSPVDVGGGLAGRPALINVWASWCQPCRQELPILDAYANTAGAVQVLGVQVQSDPVDGLHLLASLGVHFPSVTDTASSVAAALRLPNYLPVSYVVLADGTIQRVEPPTPFATVEQVETVVARYLVAVTGPR